MSVDRKTLQIQQLSEEPLEATSCMNVNRRNLKKKPAAGIVGTFSAFSVRLAYSLEAPFNAAQYSTYSCPLKF